MVERAIDKRIMKTIEKYIKKISQYYKIEPHPITKADYENNSNHFVQEVMNTGIELKVA